MKKFNVLLVLVLALAFVACKKETKIEKNLWKKGGEWNIVSWEEKTTSNYFEDDNYSGTDYNVGTMKFNEDGSGAILFKNGSDVYSEPFKYENTENTLTLIGASVFNNEENEGTIFDLDWEKNDFVISTTMAEDYNVVDAGENITVQYTRYIRIHCEKE